MMKIIAVLVVLFLGGAQLFSQALFTYGPHAVGKDEFLRAYNKNKTAVIDKEQSLKEYLDLYIKFKLKVKYAQEMRLDTLQQLQYDLQNFRSQVAGGYMNDEEGVNRLVMEALQRYQKDIKVVHFYINITPAMSAGDTLKAYRAMNELTGLLKTGNTDYEELLRTLNEKFPGVQGKDLGYITTFTLPYSIENLVYNLKPGEVSTPHRTKSALHLFKNSGERKSAGRWKIAQVLLAVPPNATPQELKIIEARADSLYTLLIGGADFATLAKQFSEDKLTFMNGGEMPEFGTGKFEMNFESKVFELQKDGDISKPIFTGYGYHIVKRLQQRAIPIDKSDEVFVTTLKDQVLNDSRIGSVNAEFAKVIQKKTGFKRNALVKDTELFRYADSVTVNNQVGKYPLNNKIIFSFAKQQVKGADWLNFIKDFKMNPDVYKGESNAVLLDKYITNSSFDYYRKYLETYNKEFNYQMQEFKEGNMLFEIMERNIWSKASIDSVGLRKYYNQHKANYTWAASASILLFNCSDQAAADAAIIALRNGKNWKDITKESEGKLQSDSGRYELSQLQIPEGTTITERWVSMPVVNSGDNTTSFFKVLSLFPANQPRSFEEARGLIINDYQSFLEEKWMESLKKKYPFKVNDAVFQSLMK